MTRSMFDPTGDETERGRSPFLGPAPTQHSTMPPAAVDGKDEGRDDAADADEAANAEDEIIAPFERDDIT